MGFLKPLAYVGALVAAVVAALLGFFAVHPIPEGRAFATIVPLVSGRLPATLVGDDWWETRSPVPVVPADLLPAARPAGELFLQLGADQMPANGLGLCCRPTAYDFHSVSRSVLWYLLKGGRHLDTAQLYLNHKAVGAGLREAMRRGVPRHEVFLVTKINPRFYSGDAIDQVMPEFLSDLGVEYIDLVLLHHPQGFGGVVGLCPNGTAPACRANAWLRLSDLRDRGIIRHVGVSNFNIHQMDELRALERAPVAANQLQYNPWAPDWQHEVVEDCQKKGTQVVAWGSFQGTMMQHAEMFTVATLQEIASARGVTVAQVLLRWALQKRCAVIPGTGNPKHMEDNLAVASFRLSEEDVSRIDAVRSDPKAKGFTAMGFEYNDS